MAIAAFRAGEAVSANDFVYVSSGGFIFKASGDTEAKASAVGVALDPGAVGSLVRVDTDSVVEGFSGLTPGLLYYISIAVSGTVVPYSTWGTELSSVTGSGAYLTTAGRATSTTKLEVELTRPTFVIKEVFHSLALH
jgi:hypothetical protein